MYSCAAASILHGYSEGPELRFQIADSHPQQQATARQVVERRHLLCEDQRIALRKDDDPGTETDCRRLCGDECQCNGGVEHRDPRCHR